MREAAAVRSDLGESGMSLVEMLVAMVLVALTCGALTSGLTLGLKYQSGQHSAAGASEAFYAQLALRRIIESSWPGTTVANDGSRHPSLQGTEGSLRVLVELPDQYGVGGLYELAFLSRSDGAKRHFVVQSRRFPGDPSKGRHDHETVLVESIADVRFRYAGGRASAEMPWQSTWLEQRTPPQLVSIDVTFPETDRRRWPNLQVAPLLKEARLP